MLHRQSLILLGLVAVACATPPPPKPAEKQPWPGMEPRAAAQGNGDEGARVSAREADAKARRDVMEELGRLLDRDPRGWAARYPKPDQCELAARALRPVNPDRAWRALSACVERGQFKLLNRLTDGFWDEELKSQPRAAIILGNVIAARGGDLANDVEVLQRRRIPLFRLETVTTHPEFYKGRSVIFSASVGDITAGKNGAVTAKLWLVQMVGKERLVAEKYSYGKVSRSTKVTNDWDEDVTVQYDNEAQETEDAVIGKLARSDPFFSPGRRFVVVGRFDGFMTPSATPDEPEPDKIPVATIFAYFEPGAQALE